jgi:hypothetical protein
MEHNENTQIAPTKAVEWPITFLLRFRGGKARDFLPLNPESAI